METPQPQSTHLESTDTAELYKAMFAVQGLLAPIRQDCMNEATNSRFASLANILETLIPLLQANKLLLQHHASNNSDFTRIGVTQKLVHVETGQFISDTYWLPVTNNHPQAHATVQTYLIRYLIKAAFVLSFKWEDDDGNLASATTVQLPDTRTPISQAPASDVRPSVAAQAAGDAPAPSAPEAPQLAHWVNPDSGDEYMVGKLCMRQIERMLTMPLPNLMVAESEAQQRFSGTDLAAFNAAIAVQRKRLSGALPGDAPAALMNPDAAGVRVDLT